MKITVPFLVVLLILLLPLSAGCLSGSDTGSTTATNTPIMPPESPALTPTVVSLSPGPTQTLPPEYYVEVQVQKQGQDGVPTITVIFRGGTGMSFTSRVDIVVTRSDGIVETATMERPQVGSERNLEGTKLDDRVEITVLVDTGNSYKIYDQLLPYQSINP